MFATTVGHAADDAIVFITRFGPHDLVARLGLRPIEFVPLSS